MSSKTRPEYCPNASPGFAYARTKALRYLEVGATIYRENDFYQMPRIEWTKDELTSIQNGCEQIADCKGYLPESPLTGLGIVGIYKLITFLHFERLRVDSTFDEEHVTDKMTLKHSVTGSELILYNRVAMDQSSAP